MLVQWRSSPLPTAACFRASLLMTQSILEATYLRVSFRLVVVVEGNGPAYLMQFLAHQKHKFNTENCHHLSALLKEAHQQKQGLPFLPCISLQRWPLNHHEEEWKRPCGHFTLSDEDEWLCLCRWRKSGLKKTWEGARGKEGWEDSGETSGCFGVCMCKT